MRNFTDQEYDNLSSEERGYYQHVKLEDIVNDFMMAEVGDGMLIPTVRQHLVEYHAQRGMQELTYDTLKSVKTFEYSPEGSLTVVLPQDLVNIVAMYWTDQQGNKHFMNERITSGAPLTNLEDQDGNNLYDENGNYLKGDGFTLESWNNARILDDTSYFNNYYFGAFANEDLFDRYFSYYGRRFGATPGEINYNGTYIYNADNNLIYIDEQTADKPIVVDYISDGLADFADIKVHKFAEEAIYAYIRWKLVYSQRNMPLYEKQMAKKEYAVAKRRAKHRLSGLGEHLVKTIRNMGKWIKH